MAKKKQGDGFTRTPEDERDFDDVLRREHAPAHEVSTERAKMVKGLLESQERLLAALIASEESLLFYRRQSLRITQLQLKAYEGRDIDVCVPGCLRHTWDDADGWHYADPERDRQNTEEAQRARAESRRAK